MSYNAWKELNEEIKKSEDDAK